MRKIIILIIIGISTFIYSGCANKSTLEETSLENRIEDSIDIEENIDNEIKVEIIADQNQENFDGMPIRFSPKVTNIQNKELEYHWILEQEEFYYNILGFYIPDKGHIREIINYGEEVTIGLFADVSWVEGAYYEFKVKLEVKEKNSDQVIDEDEIIIENHAGVYKIK